MMSKLDNIDAIQQKIYSLLSDIEKISKEYETISESTDSLPVISLRDSLNLDLGKKISFSPLRDFDRSVELRKSHQKKVEELESKRSEYIIASIDNMISSINNI